MILQILIVMKLLRTPQIGVAFTRYLTIIRSRTWSIKRLRKGWPFSSTKPDLYLLLPFFRTIGSWARCFPFTNFESITCTPWPLGRLFMDWWRHVASRSWNTKPWCSYRLSSHWKTWSSKGLLQIVTIRRWEIAFPRHEISSRSSKHCSCPRIFPMSWCICAWTWTNYVNRGGTDRCANFISGCTLLFFLLRGILSWTRGNVIVFVLLAPLYWPIRWGVTEHL